MCFHHKVCLQGEIWTLRERKKKKKEMISLDGKQVILIRFLILIGQKTWIIQNNNRSLFDVSFEDVKSTTHSTDVSFLFDRPVTGLIGSCQCHMTEEWNGCPLYIPGAEGNMTVLISRRKCSVLTSHPNEVAVYSERWCVQVPAGSCEEQDFVGVKRFPLHQEGHIRHLFIVQEVRIWKVKKQENVISFFW